MSQPNPPESPSRKVAVSIILPYYNERATVEQCLGEIRAAMGGREDYEIVVVNDGSSELDAPALERLADRVVHHRVNRGYGASVKTGIRNSAGETLVILDADATYAPRDIPQLLARLDACDMAVGDRSHYPASWRNIGPWHRRAAKQLLAATANYLAATRIPDLNSGMRAFRRADVERFLRLTPARFSLTATLTLAYICDGLAVEFVPIEYRPRQGSARSKVRPLYDTLSILMTIVRTVMFFNPFKVFLPASAALLLAGVLVLAYCLLRVGPIHDGTISVLLLSGVQVFVLGLVADMIARSRR